MKVPTNNHPVYTGDCTMKDCNDLYDMKVMMQPSYKCNQNCWFCQEWDNTSKIWTKDDCDKVLSKLEKMPEDKKSIYFLFHGGEPTLCRHWEYFHYRLVDIWKDRELFIQTQTNLSMNKKRLEKFLDKIHEIKPSHHVIDISSSYHIGKQNVDDFIEKMKIYQKYVGFGPCSFTAELIHKEKQTLYEYNKLVDSMPPGKIWWRPVVVNDVEDVFERGDAGMGRMLPDNEFRRYKELLESDREYYAGKKNGATIEYKYMLRHFPEMNHVYTPFNFNCLPNANLANSRWKNLYVTKCVNTMLGNTHALGIEYSDETRIEDIISDLYDRAIDLYEKQGAACVQNVKFMKCNSGRKGMEIAYDMTVHHCHMDTPFKYPDKNPTTTIDEIDMSTWFKRDIMCFASECICGQDWRWKEYANVTRGIREHVNRDNSRWFDK